MASKRTATALLNITRLVPSTQRSATICAKCHRQLAREHKPSSTALHSARYLSSTATQFKKSSASAKSSKKSPKISSGSAAADEHIPDNKSTKNKDEDIDPYDHSDLERGISQAIARLKDALVKTKDAGRVTPAMLETLEVELNIKHPDQSKAKGKSEAPHHERTRLGDIASVVPKGGRMLQVFAAEETHVKPLVGAIMASEHSLNPEVDANNPLLVLVPVPPATAETRAQAVVEAKKCLDKASLEVRNARGDAQKRFRKMELNKLVIQDELRKAHKSMEDVAKKGQDEVKRVFDAAVKTLQQ